MDNNYILYGASGHGKVIVDVLEKMDNKIIGFLDDNENLWGTNIYGYKVVGGIENLNKYKNKLIIISIGNNTIRKKIVDELNTKNINYGIAIHPSAQIGRGTIIGIGTVVMANAVVNSDTKIGNHCIINTSAIVDHECCLGDYVHISPGSHIGGGVKIGEMSWIGIGCTVKHLIKIGVNSVVGAGSVIINDIPDNTIYIGNPAKFLRNT